MHKRYAQCRGKKNPLRKLALLLATHSRATPKQAKEPNVPKLTKYSRKQTAQDRHETPKRNDYHGKNKKTNKEATENIAELKL
jgi:hypothetical protein